MADFPCCKLEIFIPETHLELLRQALLAADAGILSRVGVADVLGDRRPEVLALTKSASDASEYDLGIFDAAGALQRRLKLDFVRNEAAGLVTALDPATDGRRS